MTRDLKKLPKKYLSLCPYLSLSLPVDTHTNQLKNAIATELVTAPVLAGRRQDESRGRRSEEEHKGAGRRGKEGRGGWRRGGEEGGGEEGGGERSCT